MAEQQWIGRLMIAKTPKWVRLKIQIIKPDAAKNNQTDLSIINSLVKVKQHTAISFDIPLHTI